MLHAGIVNDSDMWIPPAQNERGSMAHMFLGPKLMPLHQH